MPLSEIQFNSVQCSSIVFNDENCGIDATYSIDLPKYKKYPYTGRLKAKSRINASISTLAGRQILLRANIVSVSVRCLFVGSKACKMSLYASY